MVGQILPKHLLYLAPATGVLTEFNTSFNKRAVAL